MMVLKAGQKLWWVDRNNQTEGYVIVAEITSDKIRVWYNGRIKERPHSAIGKTLFLTPQLGRKEKESRPERPKNPTVSKTAVKLQYIPYYRKKHVADQRKSITVKEVVIENRFFEPVGKQEKSCGTCALRKNGSCTSLQNYLCEDYKKLQTVSVDERNAYPQYGDAMAYRKRDRKHFK